MRDIKFRAYLWSDRHTNDQWVYSDKDGMEKFWREVRLWQAHKEIMEFTGLRDKNNKDIYESDIFQYHKNKRLTLPSFKGTVGWLEGYACFAYQIQGEYYKWPFVKHDELDTDFLANMDVIGNVWENPELINSPDIGEVVRQAKPRVKTESDTRLEHDILLD